MCIRDSVTTVTDALHNVQATHTNGSGKTLKTIQKSGPDGEVTTSFEYDGIQRLSLIHIYDPAEKHWVALERVRVDKKDECVVSKTTHFTNMINGVIQAPESPQTEGLDVYKRQVQDILVKVRIYRKKDCQQVL